jgi:hypothetical protein
MESRGGDPTWAGGLPGPSVSFLGAIVPWHIAVTAVKD